MAIQFANKGVVVPKGIWMNEQNDWLYQVFDYK